MPVGPIKFDIKKIEQFQKLGLGHVAVVFGDIGDDGNKKLYEFVVQGLKRRKRSSQCALEDRKFYLGTA